MSKYNHSKKSRRLRVWFENVGDGGKLSREHKNPNDGKKK